MEKIRVTLVRSPIGRPENHKRIVKSLGLKKLHQTVEHFDNPRIRGMLEKIPHMIRVEILEDK